LEAIKIKDWSRREGVQTERKEPIIEVMKALFLSLLLLAATGRSLPAFAQATEIPETYEDSSDRYTSRQKLQRGLANTATGWMEIPYRTFSEVVFGSRSPFEGLVIGLVSGTAKAFERTGIGLFETATFYIPNYAPILKPEYAGLTFGSVAEDFGNPKEGLHVRPPAGVK